MPAHRFLRPTLTLLLTLGALLHASGGWAQDDPANDAWRQFRQAHWFHSDAIAVSEPDAQGRRILVIAEPPQQLSFKSIEVLLRGYATEVHAQRHALMSGGEVIDVVATLKPLPTAADLMSFSDSLHAALFGTARGARLLRLPATAPEVLASSLDLSVSADDLHRHLLLADPALQSSVLQPAMTVKTVLAREMRGVFQTERTPGFVIWALPRGGDISLLRDQVRDFVLQGDLVLGALADARTVLLVARKRYEPLRRLPPLRNETLQLLAAVKASAISQSYERNMWLSGRTGDGFDRAPIYLSNELHNTEYGSLLNIVDQLLKGWSEGGHVAYKDFPYPKPRSYPFDPIRASETAADQQQAFLFNWNTEGVFYASTVDGVEIAAAYRTGSLPVIYGSIEKRRLETEAKGYRWFSNSGDANVARVVQYATLFALFKRYGVTSHWLDGVDTSNSLAAVNVAAARDSVAFAADLKRDTAKWQPRHQRVFEQSSPEFVALFSKTEALLDRLNAQPDEPRQAQIRKLGVLLGDPRSERPRLARAADETLRSAGATPADKARAKADLEAIEDASLLESFFKQSRLGVKLADSRKVWEELAEVNAREARGWIRTAAVVASRDTVQLDAVGGHSIDAAMTTLKMDESLPIGVVRAVRGERGQVTINYSPADRARIGVISRKVSEFNPGTTIAEAETQLSAAVRNAPATARPLATVLGQGGGPSPLPDHLLAQRSVEQRLRVVAPWPPQAQEFASRYRPTLLVRSSNDHFEVLSSETGEALLLETPAALRQVLVDHARAGALQAGRARIVLDGFSEGQRGALIHSVQARLGRGSEAANEGVFIAYKDGHAHIAADMADFKPRWRNAQIDEQAVTFRTVSEGTMAGSVEVTMPLRVAGQPGFFARLIIYFRGTLLTAAERSAVVAKVLFQLRLLSESEVSLATAGGRLKKGLRDAGVDLNGVEIRLDADDVLISESSPRLPASSSAG